jgi:GNAT superfamily N-acetyltransferase
MPVQYAFLIHGEMRFNRKNATLMKYYQEALLILLLQCEHPFNNARQINTYVNALKKEPVKAWFYWKTTLPDIANPMCGLWIAVENGKVIAVVHQISFALDRIATHPSHTGKGVMKALLSHITKYYEFVLSDMPISSPVNNEVIPLFKKIGWEIMLESKNPIIRSCVHDICGESKAMFPNSNETSYKDHMSYNKIPFYNALLFHSKSTIRKLK